VAVEIRRERKFALFFAKIGGFEGNRDVSPTTGSGMLRLEWKSMLAEVDLTLQDVSGGQDEFAWPFAITPVFLEGHGPFPFGIEIGRGRTMLTEKVVRAIGIDPATIQEKITLKGQSCTLDFPLLRLKSLAIGSAEIRDFDVMVWGIPSITWETQRQEKTRIEAPIENVRPFDEEDITIHPQQWVGIIGFDFLKSFSLTFDFPGRKLRLQSVT
jgi:hypothetical protein